MSPRHEVPVVRRRQRISGYDESSTQFSSSDADADEASAQRLAKHLSPVRRHASALAPATTTMTMTAVSSGGGRAPPPRAPERRPVSRNNSLSPLRLQRRSKTPEHHSLNEEADGTRQEATNEHVGVAPAPESVPPPIPVNGDAQRRASLRRDSLPKPDVALPQRKRSVDAQPPEALAPTTPAEEVPPAASADAVATAPAAGLLHKLFARFRLPRAAKSATGATATDPLATAAAMEGSADAGPEKLLSGVFLRRLAAEARDQWLGLVADYPRQVAELRRLRRKYVSHTIVLIMLCGFGGLMFRYTEGAAENIYKFEVRKVKRDFIEHLWTVSHSMREDDWKSLARQKLRKFEDEMHALQELGVRRYPGMKSWNFVNCILYCWTVITTIVNAFCQMSPRHEVPVVRRRKRISGYDESLTQFSSSDADADEASAQRLAKHLSPVRRHASALAPATTTMTVVSSGGGRAPPPRAPERRPVSRNNSLSPLRLQRRSKTPEHHSLNEEADGTRQEATNEHVGVAPAPESVPPPIPVNGDAQRRASLRRDSLPKPDVALPQRKRSVDAQPPEALAPTTPAEEVPPAASADAVATAPAAGLLHKLLARFRLPRAVKSATGATAV